MILTFRDEYCQSWLPTTRSRVQSVWHLTDLCIGGVTYEQFKNLAGFSDECVMCDSSHQVWCVTGQFQIKHPIKYGFASIYKKWSLTVIFFFPKGYKGKEGS